MFLAAKYIMTTMEKPVFQGNKVSVTPQPVALSFLFPLPSNRRSSCVYFFNTM